MKNLFLALLIAFSFISCKAQEVSATKVLALDLTVMYVENGTAGLYNAAYAKTFKGAANGLSEKDVQREYTFILEITDCHNCKVKDVIIIDYSPTPLQADKDVKKMLRDNISVQNKK